MGKATKAQRMEACEILGRLRSKHYIPNVVTRHEATWLSWEFGFTTPAGWEGDHGTPVRLTELALMIARKGVTA